MNGGVSAFVSGQRVVRLISTPPMAAKVLAGPSGPVLLLVGSAAGLLSGDTVRVHIELAPGSRLTVRTTAATIAHPCVDGGSTTLEVDCVLGAGAHLAWLPEPLIACAGCRHHGRARVTLGGGAVAVWLDSLTLGRTGERPGGVEQRLDVSLEGRPLLRDGLRVGAAGWDGPAMVGPYHHVAAVHLLGRRVVSPPAVAGVMQLAGPGSTARLLAHRGDQLATGVAAILPFFLDPCSSPCPMEAAHV